MSRSSINDTNIDTSCSFCLIEKEILAFSIVGLYHLNLHSYKIEYPN